MAVGKEAELPEGFECECGKHNEYPMYVYAHWNFVLNFKCECGRRYEVCRGFAEKSQPNHHEED